MFIIALFSALPVSAGIHPPGAASYAAGWSDSEAEAASAPSYNERRAVRLIRSAIAASTAAHGPIAASDTASWFESDDYPASALRQNEQGAVRFALQVSATGAVTGCRIVESSGFADLDGQTCASARQHARFAPAADAKGRPVASEFVQRTCWVLPTDTGPEASDTPFGMSGGAMNMATAMATVDVGAQGRVLRCKLTRAANTPVDPCSAFPVGKAVIALAIVDGKAVPAIVTATTIIIVKAPKPEPQAGAGQ